MCREENFLQINKHAGGNFSSKLINLPALLFGTLEYFELDSDSKAYKLSSLGSTKKEIIYYLQVMRLPA